MVERIKKLASIQGVTLSRIENELGLSNGIIGKWKTQEPSAYKLLAVANYLKCSVDYLLTGNDAVASLSENEKHMISIMKNLNEKNQIMLIGVADNYAKTLPSYSENEYDLKQEASNE